MIPSSTKNYLLNGAANGSRNVSLFDAACQMRDSGHDHNETQMALMPRALSDGLSVVELTKTIASVFGREAREPAKAQTRGQRKNSLRNRKPITYKTAPKGTYELNKRELPEPLENGAVQLLQEAFEEGENVRIVMSTLEGNEDGRPSNEGTTKPREWWITKLRDLGGNLDSYKKKGGIFVGINPMIPLGSKDTDVTKYRHVLVEFDHIPTLEEQWNLICEAKLPCTAVISSGNKSLHAWVRVDAGNLAEYEQRRKLLFDHLADHVDPVNANPSRLSRLPNSMRFNSRQELYALNVGAKSWQDFEAEIQAEAVGQEFEVAKLMNFDTENDPNNLLGQRWLCRGGSCLFVGQSGIGKSSLAMQMAVSWALGKEVFGIKPVKPLKSLLIQAENDFGDVSEMLRGTLGGLGIKTPQEATSALQDRFAIVAESVQTGEEFANAVRLLVAKHKPDLVWLDPLLSFIGDDISKQDVCSYFLRNLLNPIAHETGVVWMMMHHTPKPSTDPKSKSGWNATDHSYAGTGSSELTNWARAVCVLQSTKDEGRFVLRLAKRANRASATDVEGGRTNLIHLKHAEGSILWEQTAAPFVAEPKPKQKAKAKKAAPAKPKPTKEEIAETRSKASSKGINDLEGLIARIDKPMSKGDIYRIAELNGHGSPYLLRKHWEKVEAFLVKNKNMFSRKDTE